jgi:hypothetical protein
MGRFAIQIDARTLLYRNLVLPQTALGWIPTRDLVTVQLDPGRYDVQAQSGVYTAFAFHVTDAGLVDFDPTFDAIAAGRGTATLALTGVEVSFDASGLSSIAGGGVLLASTSMAPEDWLGKRSCRLLPQTNFMVQQGSGVVCNLMFAIGLDGRFAYDAAQDAAQGGCLSGAGTAALRFHGTALTVDVSAVSRLLAFPEIFGLVPTWSGRLDIVVLPAAGYRLQTDQGVSGPLFSVGGHGEIVLDPGAAELQLEVDKSGPTPVVRALPQSLPAPGPLVFASYPFGSFRIVVGSDASGPQQVSMERDGTVRWLIDRRWLAGQPALAVKLQGKLTLQPAPRPVPPRPVPPRFGRLTVALSGARWPGTDISADFTLVVERVVTADGVDITVTMDWASSGGEFVADGTWDGNATAAVSATGAVCKLGPERTLALSGGAAAQATFRPGHLTLAAAALARVTSVTEDLPCGTLELTLLAPGDRRQFSPDTAPPLCSRLALTGSAPWPVALPASQTPLGELARVADLFGTLDAEVGENLDGRRRQAMTLLANSNATQFQLHLGDGIADAAGRPVRVSLVACRLAFLFDREPAQAVLTAGASTDRLWTRTQGVGLALGALVVEPPRANFVLGYDGAQASVQRCELPYSGLSVALDGCVVEPAGAGNHLSLLPPGARPDGSVRNWLCIGAPPAGMAALCLHDVGFSVLRPADLLVLRFDLRGLVLQAARGATPTLQPALPGQPGYLAVSLPPQHLAEQVLPLGTTADPARDLALRLAGASRLVFQVPGGAPAQPLTLDRLLGWAGWPLSVPAVCDDPPPPLTPAPPNGLDGGTSPQTAIELPYRLLLSPGSVAGFSHARAPVTRGGWTELWHTRLGARRAGALAPGGFLVDERASPDNDAQRRMRAVWSPDWGQSPPARELAFSAPMTAADRYRIVDAGANLAARGSAAKLEVSHLMLSSQGGWLHADGAWPPVAGGGAHDLDAWNHRAAMGRDQYVRIVRRGVLFPFGHRANLATVSERRFQGGDDNAAVLVQYGKLEVTERVRDMAPMPDALFARVEILTLRTPALNIVPPLTPDLGFGTSALWVCLPPPGVFTPLRFQLRAWDRLGTPCEFSAPMIFVADDVLGRADVMDAVRRSYDAQGGGTEPVTTSPLSGQTLAYAPPTNPGDTSLQTHSLTFASGSGAGSAIDFYPRIHRAAVHLPAARALSSADAALAGAVGIRYAQPFLDAGGRFDAGNPGEVFATLEAQIPIGFDGDKSLGVASPGMALSALSRLHGTVAGAWQQVFTPAKIDLSQYFDATATLLGRITLKDLISGGIFPLPTRAQAGTGDGVAVPRLKVDTSAANAVVTTLDWAPRVDAGRTYSDPGGVFRLRFPPGAQPTFALQSRTVAPVRLPGDAGGPPSAASSVTTGRLTDFELAFAPGGDDLVVVRFAELAFRAEPGRKPDVRIGFATPDPVRLAGQLDFLQTLMDKLRGILGAGPSLKIDGGVITAGYAIAIPQLSIGIFSLQNISVGTAVAIPIVGSAPVAFRFDFAQASHPFNLTIALLGGGGYFSLAVDSTGIQAIDLAVEAGASVSLDLAGLASGSAHVMLGVSFHYAPDALAIGGYLRAGGELTVLQLISLHVEFYAGLAYVQNGSRKVIHASVSVMVEVSVAFLHQSVTLELTREFEVGGSASGSSLRLAGATGDPRPVTIAESMTQDDWTAYATAFA